MDARTQFLTVVVCYRDLIDCLLLGDAARVSEASAAFHEAMTMSRIALERLAWRLGLPND